MRNFIVGVVFTAVVCYLVSATVAQTWGWLYTNEVEEHPSKEAVTLVTNLASASSFLSVLTILLVKGDD